MKLILLMFFGWIILVTMPTFPAITSRTRSDAFRLFVKRCLAAPKALLSSAAWPFFLVSRLTKDLPSGEFPSAIRTFTKIDRHKVDVGLAPGSSFAWGGQDDKTDNWAPYYVDATNAAAFAGRLKTEVRWAKMGPGQLPLIILSAVLPR